MSDDYLWDRSGTPDPEVARLEGLLSPLAHDAPLDELRTRRRRALLVGALAAIAAAVAVYLALPRGSAHRCRGTDGFAFAGIGGAVSCSGTALARGTLPVGGTLDTGDHAATLTIADIGSARLGPQTTLRLARTDAERHQLVLDRGTMHAKVDAPPRLFAVTTPHTEVVDLGCEYDITIGPDGAGSLTVLDGLVELATRRGTLVTVPAGCDAKILGEHRPGLPICATTSPNVAAAARAYDAGDPAAVATILAEAGSRDAIVVLALAAVDAPNRVAILQRLAELAPPPDAITAESAVADPAQLASWSEDIVATYFAMWLED